MKIRALTDGACGQLPQRIILFFVVSVRNIFSKKGLQRILNWINEIPRTHHLLISEWTYSC